MKNDYSSCSDERLMLFLLQGEALAFDVIYVRYSRRLLGYFIRMLNYDREKAQDALQDLFLKIVEQPGAFDTTRRFQPWIYALAFNTCKNYYKYSTRVKVVHEELHYTGNALDEGAFLKAAEKMDAVQFRSALDYVLNELPIEKKTVFVLRYQEDHSLQEIADITNCSEGTVKSRLHYTLKILEERLKIFNPVNK
jgi:RNA polymerase sigma-70 factor (ECF subfamily)